MAGTVQTFLKVLIGANTKGFRKDMTDGEKAVQKFAGETKGALDKFAEVFGIDLDRARRQTKAFSESMVNVGKGLKTVSTGSTALSTSLKILRTALIATGVGALVVALAAVATYFTKAEAGSKAFRSEISQMKAVGEVLLDRLGTLGKSIVLLFQGNAVESWQTAKEAFTGIGSAARSAGLQAKMLADSMYELEYAERQFNVTSSEQNILLEDYRLKARDLDLSARERLDNLQKAGTIEKRINKEALAIAAEKILNAQLAVQIDQDDKDAKEALAQAYVNYNNLVAQSITFDRQLTREKNALIREIRKEDEAQKELLATMKAENTIGKVSTGTKPTIPGMNELHHTQITTLQTASALSDEMKDMYEATEQSIENLTIGFGDWMGAFSAGLSGFRGMRQLVGNAFGDMLITLGQIAVRAGIGIEAIKKAFTSLGGVGSIAIGMGLIAFGSSIKGSIQQINNARDAASAGSFPATSMGSGGGSATFGTYTSGGTVPKLKLTGEVTLKLTGKDLVALLNEENARVEIVT